MTLKDITLNENNHFVVMEYYMLILNRTYLVLLLKEQLIGIQVNGLVSAEGGENMAARQVSKSLAIQGNLNDPQSYIKENYLHKAENINLRDGSIIAANKSNFIINRNEIATAYYNPKKKWGMGYYPHDGKVYVETKNHKKREFIIVGNQSGHKIANLIMAM